jgi:hypothetical protein
MPAKAGETMRSLVKKLRIREMTGLDLAAVITLVQDFVEIETGNMAERERFLLTKRRTLFLPHCSRKFMDGRCKATFDARVPSYVCGQCSPDCLVNRASKIAKAKGYDVYILPGGSCIPKILKENPCEGVIGVGCALEVKLGGDALRRLGLPGQGVPLIKNGCANTVFNFDTFVSRL